MIGTNREHGNVAGDETSNPSLLDVALRYIQCGFNPVPIPFKAKRPTDKGWQERVITAENASKFFNGQAQNIGVVLGPTSGGLTDADLDCPEAIAVAPYLLPETHAIFGRQSKPRSHYLYRTSLAQTAGKAALRFQDPTDNAVLVELRVGGKSGAQTVFPGSVHESGEAVTWHKDGDPAETDGDQLLRRVRAAAAAALLVRHWPGKGSRQEAALALGGVLGGAGFSEQALEKFVRVVATAAGDEEVQSRITAAKDAAARRANGESAYGLPRLKELIGEKVAPKVAELLGLRSVFDGPAARSGNALPVIQIFPGEVARGVRDTESALIAAGQPVFVRADALVKPVSAEMPTADGAKTEVTVFRAMTAASLAVMVTEHAATFTKYDARSRRPVPIDPPGSVLQGLLQVGEWRFPHVAGIINAPTMRHDGSILSEPGYDAATALWHQPDKRLALPPVPDEPTADQAREALQVLQALFAGYPFVSELDRSVALCAILSAVTRGAYDVAPMFLFVAPAAGTGKSHLVDLVSLIARGRPCPVITAPRSDEEMEKRLGAILLEGAPILSLDNCTRDLEGDMLCQMTERPLVKTRILGESKAPEIQWRGTLLATGNNVNYAGDMVRRGLTSRLDAQAEVPERREFDFDPHDAVRADRGKYVAAALTIARAYRVSGEKAACPPIGSYGAWSRFTREPLAWLGLPDPVASMDRAREEDPKRRAARELIEHLQTHFGTQEFTVKELVGKANETDVTWQDPPLLHPELNELLVENCGSAARKSAIDPNRVGGWLRRLKGRVHADRSGVPHRIIASADDTSHGNRWRLESM